MRKLFFFFVFCISILTPLTADFINGKRTGFVDSSIASTTSRGLEQYKTLCSVQAGVENSWLESCAGIQVCKDCFDFTLAPKVYFPFLDWHFDTSRIALGAGGIYHFQRYKDISFEHDFVFNTLFRYQNLSGMTIAFYGGYALKVTSLDALSEAGALSTIRDDYPEAGILLDKVWKNGFELYFEHALNDTYRYPVFCTPHYLLGLAENFDSWLRFSGDISVRIADGYAAVPYINGLILRFGMRYTF